MTFGVAQASALEILDSRARPTLSVTVRLADGSTGTAGVPSGASTGTREATELRDGGPSRFSGGGVLTAVGHVNEEIAPHLRGRRWESLAQVDGSVSALDGTENKSRLGANAIGGVSMATARALAASSGAPLFEWLPGIGQSARLPVPCSTSSTAGCTRRTRWTSRSS
jgi:enolase